MSDADSNPTTESDSSQTATSTETATGSSRRSVDDPILELTDVVKRFGGITAVDGAAFEIERGSITGLIGPNGAGKSTTFNCITGVYEPDEGSIVFDGTDITGHAPNQVATAGLVRTFQIAREFPEMTVLENMMLAPKNQLGESLWQSVAPGTRGAVIREEEQFRERSWEVLEFFEIDHLAEEYAGTLSGGQRKLLELARALLTEPELLLLDEPMAGVNPSLEKKLLEHIHELQDQGYTFLLVEHDMDVIMNHTEHVIVMHQGSVLAEGNPESVKSDEAVIEAYLGGEV